MTVIAKNPIMPGFYPDPSICAVGEDYYLIHDLACHKYNIQNPDQFYSREGMRVAYLYAIYNDGHLNKLYLNYPTKFNDFLSSLL